jgi:drug/metabolite transporter (DMT)-like permease
MRAGFARTSRPENWEARVKHFLMILVCVLLGSAGQLALKHGMTAVGRFSAETHQLLPTFVRAFSNPWVIAGFTCYGLSSLMWMVVVSRVPLSLAYPMISMGYVIVVIMSRFLLNEEVSALRFAGTLVICAGVVLVSRS